MCFASEIAQNGMKLNAPPQQMPPDKTDKANPDTEINSTI